jgi:hypothetical protein
LKLLHERPAVLLGQARAAKRVFHNPQTLVMLGSVKVVGKRRLSEDSVVCSPEEALRRAAILQAQVELLNPYPRPRGFIFKAKTRAEYERWRKAQANPRLW